MWFHSQTSTEWKQLRCWFIHLFFCTLYYKLTVLFHLIVLPTSHLKRWCDCPRGVKPNWKWFYCIPRASKQWRCGQEKWGYYYQLIVSLSIAIWSDVIKHNFLHNNSFNIFSFSTCIPLSLSKSFCFVFALFLIVFLVSFSVINLVIYLYVYNNY